MNSKLIEDLWVRGAGHLLGAKALERTSTDFAVSEAVEDVGKVVFNGPLSASTHLLIGYGFELNLKAMYLLHGGDEAKLWKGKSPIGHDLIAALDAAESCGFWSSVSNLRWILEHLRDSHLGHHFRYGGSSSITIPSLENSLPALEQLTDEVRLLGMAKGVIVRSTDFSL